MTHRNTPRANGDFSCQCGVWGSHGWMGYALHLEPLLDQLDAAQEALRLADAALLAFWEFVDQPSSCHLPRPTWPKEHKEAAAAARARQEEP